MKSTEASDILTERHDYSIFRLNFTSAKYEKSPQKLTLTPLLNPKTLIYTLINSNISATFNSSQNPRSLQVKL